MDTFTPDIELIRRYADERSQDAFAELVRRHVDFVYSVAVRQTHNRDLAQDVAQAVFIILAKKAGRLRANTVLSNWLFCATRYTAANALKMEARRRHYEHRKMAMTREESTATNADRVSNALPEQWSAIAPLLDSALTALGRRDREAVLLRFIEGKSHRDVAGALGLSEDAARKRVSRAIEQLRSFFQSRGVVVPAAALATMLTAHAVEAAPVSVTTAACGFAGLTPPAGAALAKGTITLMAWAKVKVAAVVAASILLAGTTGTVVVRHLMARPAAAVQVRSPVQRASAPVTPVADVAGAGAPANPVKDIEAVVRGPDDAPLAGAEVFAVTADANLTRLPGGQLIPVRKEQTVNVYAPQWPSGTEETDGTGRFSLPAPSQPWILIIRHPVGFIQITREEFQAMRGRDIILQPWGRVEGTVLVGTAPQAGWTVQLSRWGSADDWSSMAIRHDRMATTDAQGKFVFDNVAPGDSWISHSGGKKPPRGGQILHDRKMTLLEIAPGKTVQANLGGTGQPVVGRLELTVKDDPEFRLIIGRNNQVSFDARFSRTDVRQPPADVNDPKLTPEERRQRYRAWLKTPQGKEHQRMNWVEPFDVNPDGTFRIDDVRPGTYFACFSYNVREANGQYSEDLIQAGAKFTIPPLPGGRSDQPLDIGTIQPTLRPRLLPGKPAPDFAAKTLDGDKAFKLSDYRGKYVILNVVWNWDKADEMKEQLDKVQRVIAGRKDFVLINLTFDDVSPAGKRELVAKGIGGVHAYMTYIETNLPAAYRSGPLQMVLIDPAGNVRIGRLQREQADAEVAKVVLEQ